MLPQNVRCHLSRFYGPPMTEATRPLVASGSLRSQLSSGQRRLWFIDQLQGTSPEYNFPDAVRLIGLLDVVSLTRSLQAVVDRHGSLRTRFVTIDGEPVQIVMPTMVAALSQETLHEQARSTCEQRVRAAMQQEWDEPFDLERGPLFRFRLLSLSPREHVLLRTCHHIVFDDWSRSAFNEELSVLYDAFQAGRANPLAPLRIQYVDYARWEQNLGVGSLQQAGLSYWRTQLAGARGRIELPADRPRDDRSAGPGERIVGRQSVRLVADLKKMCAESGATLYMVLLAALAVLLNRYTTDGDGDIMIGCPIAKRPDPRLENLIGFFVNSLPLRVRLSPDLTFRALLDQVRQTALDAYEHSDVPFDQIVQQLGPARSGNVAPLFQIALVLQSVQWREIRLDGVTCEQLVHDRVRMGYDIEVYWHERDGKCDVTWSYRSDLYDRWRIEQLAKCYSEILRIAAATPDRLVSDFDVADQRERAAMIAGVTSAQKAHANSTGYWAEPRQSVVGDWICRRVHTGGDEIAVETGQETQSYRELFDRAEMIATALRRARVTESDVVAILVEKAFDWPAAVVGVLRAGCGYVPLDPQWPDERIATILTDCRPRAVLVDTSSRVRIGAGEKCIVIDRCRTSRAPHAVNWQNDSACYVYFTSGSTGRPKGIAGRRSALDHFIEWEIAALGLEPGLRVGQLIGLGFDPYLRDLFVPLCLGGTICIPPTKDVVRDGEQLSSWIEDARIELLHCVPSVLRTLLRSRSGAMLPTTLRHVMVCGEPLLPADVGRWFDVMPDSARLVNVYGPTETTLAKFFHFVTPDDAGRRIVPVGKPIPGATGLVVDSNGRACPPGLTGEVWIWTPYGSGGYYRRPALTSEVFIPSPFGEPSVVPIYKTGDFGRSWPDGTIELVGRRDGQVKILGNRVEVAEVEAALATVPGVTNVAVVARDGSTGEKQLIAYVVGRTEAATMRAHLRRRLPDHMIPAMFVSLDTLPLGPTGKVDRRTLAATEVPQRKSSRAPVQADERRVCEILGQLLAVNPVSLDDNFFELGGHSLLAIRFISLLHAEFGRDLPLSVVMAADTVEELVVASRAHGR